MPQPDPRVRAAALAGGGAVLAIAAAIGAAAALAPGTRMAVYPDMSWQAQTLRALAAFGFILMLGVPFALVAAWRVAVHARAGGRGVTAWRGLAEAALVGVAVASPLLILALRNFPDRPAATVIYVAGYAALAAGVGVGFGCLVRLAAIAALRRTTVPPSGGPVAADSRSPARGRAAGP
jgi:hypothetical protein